MDELERMYGKLKKKYKLPSYKELDNLFEISLVEPSKFFLRDIRRKMAEKIEDCIKVLEELIQPENNVINMHEFNELNEEEHQRVLKLFRTLMKLDRGGVVCEVNIDEKCVAAFINSVYGQWPDIRTEMIFITGRLRSAWEKKLYIKENLEYLG